MYESPIEFFTKTVTSKIAAEIDEKALEAVFQCGFSVNRDELEKALRYDRDQWRKGFADGVEHAQPKWISVKDRLPKKHEEVLACTDDGCMDVLWLGDAMGVLFWEDNNFMCFPKDSVAYWMPLPEPPKEEE